MKLTVTLSVRIFNIQGKNFTKREKRGIRSLKRIPPIQFSIFEVKSIPNRLLELQNHPPESKSSRGMFEIKFEKMGPYSTFHSTVIPLDRTSQTYRFSVCVWIPSGCLPRSEKIPERPASVAKRIFRTVYRMTSPRRTVYRS